MAVVLLCVVCNADYFTLIVELFDNYMQQDAHEFLNYLLNTVADLLQGEFPKIFLLQRIPLS